MHTLRHHITETAANSVSQVRELLEAALANSKITGTEIVRITPVELGGWVADTKLAGDPSPMYSARCAMAITSDEAQIQWVASSRGILPDLSNVLDEIACLIDKLHCRATLAVDDVETHNTARDLRRAVTAMRERAF